MDIDGDTCIAPGRTQQSVQLVEGKGGCFTIFPSADALTRVARRMKYTGDRVEADEKAGQLLALVA